MNFINIFSLSISKKSNILKIKILKIKREEVTFPGSNKSNKKVNY